MIDYNGFIRGLAKQLKEYLTPAVPVVDTRHISIDMVVYVLLYTICNPVVVSAWYIVFGTYGCYALAVILLWIGRGLNRKARSAGGKLPDKFNVVVTGGSKGLGLEIVKAWIDTPDCGQVIVLDVERSKEIRSFEEVPRSKVSFIECDMGDSESFEAAMHAMKEMELPSIDVVICNAGVRQRKPLSKLTGLETERFFKVNYLSHAEMIRRSLKQDRPANARIHIVGIASVLGFIAPKTLGVYSGTKASVIDLLDALPYEVDDPNVAVSTVCPGQLDTTMFSDVTVQNHFLAPLVDHRRLAERTREIVLGGYNGLFVYPLYGRLIPALKVAPYWLYRLLREYSGMDAVV